MAFMPLSLSLVVCTGVQKYKLLAREEISCARSASVRDKEMKEAVSMSGRGTVSMRGSASGHACSTCFVHIAVQDYGNPEWSASRGRVSPGGLRPVTASIVHCSTS
eukprot:2517907-Amphidinium_carterae.2